MHNSCEPSSMEDTLQKFSYSYAGYHGYVSLTVCIVGVCCNLINIVVLTRVNMRNATNLLLCTLAVSDLLTMASYIPFALQFYILHGLEPAPERNTKAWMVFFVFHVNLTVTTHTISIWLGVLLSIYRWAFIKIPHERNIIYSMTHIQRAFLIVVISSVIILVPNYVSITVGEIDEPAINGTSYYVLKSSSHESRLRVIATYVNFWIHAILIKLLPCVILTVFGVLLICTLKKSNQRRVKLRRVSSISWSTSIQSKEHSRTTIMLLVVIILFLLTELPQGILALCSGLRNGFFEAYYIPLGDVMDIVALLNNGINFTLYCSMSEKFRNTFVLLFLPIVIEKQHKPGGFPVQVITSR